MVTDISPLKIAWARLFKSGSRTLDRIIPFALAAVVTLLTAVALLRLDNFEREQLHQIDLKQVQKELDIVRFRLEATMAGPLAHTRGVAAQIIAHGDVTPEEFARVAEVLIGGNRNIRDMVVSRGTVIAMVYPLAENRAALGTDYRTQPGQWPSVSRAIRGRKPVLNGPVQLVQGGSGLIVRDPVFLPNPSGGEEIFFGLVSVVLDIPATLADAGIGSASLPIEVAIRGRDGKGADGEMVYGDEQVFHRDAVEMDVALPYGSWRIAGVAKGGSPTSGSRLLIAHVLAGFLFLFVGTTSFGTALHIVQRDKSRRELLGSRQLLKTIIDTLPLRVFWKSRDLRYLGCNPAFARDAGKTHPDEMIGLTDFQMSWAEQADLYRADDRAILESGIPRLFYEEAQTTPEGRKVWLRTSKTPLIGGDGEIIGVLGLYEDITEHKRADQDLADKNRALERSNADLEQFAYVASHDLQTPLRNIVRYSQLLERRYRGRLDADADDFIGFIVDNGKQMTRLINDLLEFSRVSRQTGPSEAIAAGEAVALALNTLKDTIQEAGAEVAVGNLPMVLAEQSHLVSLFQNLLGNGLKYRSPDRPPRLSVMAERQPPDLWLFAVADNGIGIEPAYHEKIFEIFQRLNPACETEGTGIGLTLCRRIVERSGGTIWVSSQPGKGTTFFFTLRDGSSATGSEQPE